MSVPPRIDIMIPTYNEADHIAETVANARELAWLGVKGVWGIARWGTGAAREAAAVKIEAGKPIHHVLLAQVNRTPG